MAQTDSIIRELEQYVSEAFLDGDTESQITPTTPLLEWGVLNSMNTVRLLAHIREQHNVVVPPSKIVGAHFRDLESIAALVAELSDQKV